MAVVFSYTLAKAVITFVILKMTPGIAPHLAPRNSRKQHLITTPLHIDFSLNRPPIYTEYLSPTADLRSLIPVEDLCADFT
jgi:hypothetical protein